VVQPRLRGLESVLGFDFVFRESIVEPHALVSEGEGAKGEEQRSKKKKKDAFHEGLRA
jgi:hypothetical protein